MGDLLYLIVGIAVLGVLLVVGLLARARGKGRGDLREPTGGTDVITRPPAEPGADQGADTAVETPVAPPAEAPPAAAPGGIGTASGRERASSWVSSRARPVPSTKDTV
jgi:fused signal recognition particle receptor